MKLYPFTIAAQDSHGYANYADSPYLATRVWQRLRAQNPKLKELTWYAADFTALSATSIQLRVMQIYDSFGGMGNVIYQQEVNELTEAELVLLKESIEKRALRLAEIEFERLEEEKLKDQVLALRKTLFGF